MAVFEFPSFARQYTDPKTVLGPDGRPWQEGQGMDPRFALPSVATHSTVYQTPWRSYLSRYDEALRNDPAFAKAMYRDAFTKSIIDERRLGTASLDWHIEVDDEEDPEQKAIKDGLMSIIKETKHLQKMIFYLLETIWYGRYGAQLSYAARIISLPSLQDPRRKVPTKTYVVQAHEPVNGDKIIYQWDGTPGVKVKATWANSTIPGAETAKAEDSWILLLKGTWRNRFIIHQHQVVDADYHDGEAAGGIHGVGIRSFMHWSEWLRKEWLSNVTDWAERTGLGMRIWYYQLGSETSYLETKKAAEDQSDKTNILVPRSPTMGGRGTESVEYVETRGQAADLLLRLIEHIEGHLERYVIGQSLSSGTEGAGLGGTGVADLHALTKGKIVAFDANNLADTLTSDWVIPLTRWTWPQYQGPMPRFAFALDSADPAKKLQAVNTAVAMGVSFREEDIRDLVGLAAPKDSDSVISLLNLQHQQNVEAQNQQESLQRSQMQLAAEQQQQAAQMGGGDPMAALAGGGGQQPPAGGATAAPAEEPEQPEDDHEGMAKDLDKQKEDGGKVTEDDVLSLLDDPEIGQPGHPSKDDVAELMKELGLDEDEKPDEEE